MDYKRNCYLIRHCRPDFPLDEKMCLGRTDIPLGIVGRLQAVLLSERIDVSKVYSSPLKRAVETSAYLSDNIIVVDDFAEAFAGDWDGKYFRDIKEKWPDIYAARAVNPEIAIPGSENRAAAQKRLERALRLIDDDCSNAIAVVAHSTVLAGITGKKLNYGEYWFEGNTYAAHPEMTVQLAKKLLIASGADEKLLSHCEDVAKKAVSLARGFNLNTDLIEISALLHDIAKGYPKHAEEGAAWMNYLGYPQIGSIIRQHMLPDEIGINEASIVFLADKLPVKERFEKSLKKCTSEEAKRMHNIRLDAALSIERMINEKTL